MASFKKDLFISYAHIDNQPLTPGQKGWISRFHASLEALLSMRLGQATKIWRDDKLQGDDVFSAEIVDQFTHPRRTRFRPDAAQDLEFALYEELWAR
jgi:hypothetical protein